MLKQLCVGAVVVGTLSTLSTPVEADYVRKVAEITWVRGVEHSIKAQVPQQFETAEDCGEAISQDAAKIKAHAEQHGYRFTLAGPTYISGQTLFIVTAMKADVSGSGNRLIFSCAELP
jgi:hypothetical protein